MRGHAEWTGSNFIKNLLFWPSREGCGTLVSQPGTEPVLLYWELGVFTSGLPGKSLVVATLNRAIGKGAGEREPL